MTDQFATNVIYPVAACRYRDNRRYSLRREDMVNPNKSIESFNINTGSNYTLVEAVSYSGIPPSIGGYPMTYTDTFRNPYYRRNDNLYRINYTPSTANDFLIYENVGADHFAVKSGDVNTVYLFNASTGLREVVSDAVGNILSDVDVISNADIQSFEMIISNESGSYFLGRVDGTAHTSIYGINPDLTYDIITDGLHDYTKMVPKSDEETFAVLKYNGTQTDLVLFKGDTREETIIAENIDTMKYEPIGWSANETLFAYDITTGYTPGTHCPYANRGRWLLLLQNCDESTEWWLASSLNKGIIKRIFAEREFEDPVTSENLLY